MGDIKYADRYENEIKACFVKVKIAPTGNIHIDVNSAYGISEYAMLAKHISEQNDNVAVYIWHQDWSFTYNRKNK